MPDIPARYTGPGLVDLQVNGYAGFDFNSDPESWTEADFYRVARDLKKRGVLAALPTFITDEVNTLIKRASTYASILESNPALESIFPGIHLEGPFISGEDGPRGAHPQNYCRIPKEMPGFLNEMRAASGNRVLMLTLAPELEGAVELTEKATKMGICVGIGHTGASPDKIDNVIRAGAKISTHLGNGSHQRLPRHDNYIQYQLAREELFAGFIADGHHIPFYALKNFIKAKGIERTVLVTDAMAGAEKGEGIYKLGRDTVIVREDLFVSKPKEPNLAGSALTLDRAIINTVKYCDVSFENAWKMASTYPAALIGLFNLPEITVEIDSNGFQQLHLS